MDTTPPMIPGNLYSNPQEKPGVFPRASIIPTSKSFGSTYIAALACLIMFRAITSCWICVVPS